MKHPIWILNIILIVLLSLTSSFIFFSWKKPPTREDIEPSSVALPSKGEIVKVNIQNIYENDLFGTYKQQAISIRPDEVVPLPFPPTAKPVTIPPVPTAQFLDPLNITLKGIIIILDDETNNRAIISDNTTSKESTYRVGESIEDAQVIRILNNKIIILRSNGQQEVLYLREKDAKLDPAYVSQSDWASVVKKISDTEFEINVPEFTARVKNLAQFIEMLDLITVYKQGKSIGCTIGNTAAGSLGVELGLFAHDVITNINGTPATTTPERFKIYKEITSMQKNSTIEVTVLRNQEEIIIKYFITDFGSSFKPSSHMPSVTKDISSDDLREKQAESLKQQQKFAPTLKEIRDKERANMLQKGKSSTATSVTGKVE